MWLRSKKIIRILLDLIAINATAIGTLLVFGWPTEMKLFFAVVLVLNLSWFAALLLSNRLYGRFEYLSSKNEVFSLVGHHFRYSIFILGLWAFFVGGKYTLIGVLLIGLLLSVILLRVFAKGLVSKFLLSNDYNRVAIISDREDNQLLLETFENAHLGSISFEGLISDKSEFDNVLGSPKDIFDIISRYKINILVNDSNYFTGKALLDLVNYCRVNFIELKLIPVEFKLKPEVFRIELYEENPILSTKEYDISRLRNRLFKRVFDIIFSLTTIVLFLSWFIPVMALLIRLNSKGNAFFVQKRLGLRNKPFNCYKLRSMVVNDDSDSVQASKNDARITSIGAWMRKNNVDELPQFFNVFLGDMSVVGPRPHPYNVDKIIKKEIEEYLLRYQAKPGVSGWSQVNGWRGPTVTWEQKKGRTDYDLWYLRNWSFWLDIKIIWLTLFGSKVKENAF